VEVVGAGREQAERLQILIAAQQAFLVEPPVGHAPLKRALDLERKVQHLVVGVFPLGIGRDHPRDVRHAIAQEVELDGRALA
jgi:hypothetical protein